MNPLLVGFCLALVSAAQVGQDRLPLDESQRYAKVCVELLGSLTDAPINLDVDVEKPCAFRVPVGQFWLRKWAPVLGSKAVPPERLRVVNLKVDDKDRPMCLLLLGVRKGEKGPEMVGYARETEPILVLPLKRIELIQALPLELEWQRGDQNADSLALGVLGLCQARLPMTRE